MKQLLRFGSCVALVALSALPLAAQGRGGPGGRGAGGPGGPGGMRGGSPERTMLALLGVEAVQEEIEIMPDQLEALEKVGKRPEGERFDFRGLREASEEERSAMVAKMQKANEEQAKQIRADIKKILFEPQQVRLNQLTIQMLGIQALSDPTVIEKLKITKDQISEMEKISTATRESFREVMTSGDRENIREKITEAREAEQKKLLAVLTTEQQVAFDELKGKPSEAIKAAQENRGRGGFGGRGGERGGERGGARGGERGGERGGRGGERRQRPSAE